jgi:hypothetical protein
MKTEEVRALRLQPEGNRPLVNHRRRWEDIKLDLKEKQDRGVWAGFIWTRTGTSGGILRTR